MSIGWGVIPAVPEIHDWLAEHGQVTQSPCSRYPSLDELIIVLESFDLPIRKEQVNGLWSIVFGTIETSRYAFILGKNKDDGFHFQFFGSYCQEETMLEILKRLSRGYCGALVIYEQMAATPLIVDSETDIEKSIVEWGLRIKERVAKDP